MNLEKVSIYIPAYNAEKTIKQTIVSVINQTYKFDEIIVIDDNSSDDTCKIISQFENVKLIKNKINKGLGYNRNLGIKTSKNEIVASIDADVVLNAEWLSTIIKNFRSSESIMCGGKMTEKLIENKFNLWRAKYYSQNWGEMDLDNPPFLFGCNTIQSKKIWGNVGGYDEKLLTNGEDIDYANKIKSISKFKLKYCSKALCEHMQNDNLDSLSRRVWRYHSFGYKIKKPSIYKTLKLSIKQLKFFFNRSIKDLLKFNLYFIYINFIILVNFIKLEHINYKNSKK